MLSSEEMRCVLQMEEGGGKLAGHIALTFATNTMKSGVLEMAEKDACLKNIHLALSKSMLWARCICNLLSVDQSKCKTSPKDVIYFLEYSGRAWFEKSMQQLLQKPGTFWTDMAQEVIRTGASSELLQTELRDFQDALNAEAMFKDKDATTLGNMIAKYEKLSAGMRQSALTEVSSTLCSLLLKEASSTVDSTGSLALSISSAYIDGLIRGINLFPKVPGALSAINNLQKFMTSEKQNMAVADFLEIMTKSLKPDCKIIDMAEVKDVISKMAGPASLLTRECFKFIDGFLHKMLKQLFNQAWIQP